MSPLCRGYQRSADQLYAAAHALYFMNWVRAFALGPKGLLGHTWSLAIEEAILPALAGDDHCALWLETQNPAAPLCRGRDPLRRVLAGFSLFWRCLARAHLQRI